MKKQITLTQSQELKLEDLASEQSQYWACYVYAKDYNSDERWKEVMWEEEAKEKALWDLNQRILDYEFNPSDIAYAIWKIKKEDWMENQINYK